MKKEKRKKNKGLKGYKLHLKRFEFSSKRGMRTIKFPLGEWDSNDKTFSLREEEKKFAENIKHDYEALYGPLNVHSYYKCCGDGQGYPRSLPYSLKEFWVDCLRVGMILKHSEAKMAEDIRVYTGVGGGMDEKQKARMKDVNKEFFEMIDFSKFKKEFILSGSKRITENTKESSIVRKFVNVLANPKDKKHEKRAEQYGKEFYKLMIDSDKAETIQKKFHETTFGVDFSLYSDVDEGATFCLFPSLELKKDLSSEECLERVVKFIREDLKNEKMALEECIGISDNQGGLSQIFNEGINLLRSGQLQEFKKKILSMTGSMWKGKEKDLEERILFLSKQVKKLPEPRMVKSWSEYRTDIGGKIQSWISNTFRQDEEIRGQLFGALEGETEDNKKKVKGKGHKHELEAVEKELLSFDSGDLERRVRDLQDVIKQMKALLPKLESNLERVYLHSYQDLLSDFRSKLNFLFQEKYGVDDSESDIKQKSSKKKEKKPEKMFPSLFQNLKSPPSFIGEVKIAKGGVYEKYFESLKRVRNGIVFLKNSYTSYSSSGIDRSDSEEAVRIKQALQSILQMRKDAISPVGEHIAENILKKFSFSFKDFDGSENYNYIWRSSRAREHRGEDFGSKEGEEFYLKHKEKLFKYLFVDWEKYKDLNISVWIDLIALEKVRFGLLAYFYDISSLTFSKDTRFHFEKIDPIEARFKKPFDSNVINTVVQGAILSEMKGTLSKMSTERFTMRWVVQPMNSEKVFPLISSVWKGERRADGHAYYIAPDRNLLKKDTEGDLCILKEKDFSKSYEAITTNDRNTLLKINSSRANLQFLDKSFSGFWKEQEPKLSSYSFIVEETYNVSWSDKDGVSFVPSKDNPQRLFVSIPFELGFLKSEKQNELLIRRNKLLGVDIGEYGIAMYLLDADSMREKVFTSFIFEPSLRRIREGIREGKESQRAGTFSIPSTRVQRLRDNAITILRNRIHAIVVSHNARPVYEKEVSAFESGSGKISKIYHSVKRSDVFQENEADKLEAALVWGKGSKLIGKEVSAYATSYSCSHCHESVYAYITKGEYEMEYKVIDVISAWKDKKGRPQSIFVIDVEGVHVKGFLKKACTTGDYLNGKEAQKAIRDYARPPLPIFFERHDGEKVFKKLGINKEEFKKRRGNQAIWVCPFCDAISDADVQAALWIALKGWLNLHISSNSDEQQYFKDMSIQGGWADKSIKEKMRFLLQFAKEKKIPPVQLEDC